MAVVVIISAMAALAGPSIMNALGDYRARDFTGQVVNVYNAARARATGTGRAQLVRFSAAANGGQGGLIAYEGNNSSCVASNWVAIVAAGCATGTGFCTDQLNPATRQLPDEMMQLSMRTTGNAGTWAETDADTCYEPNGITFWRAGTAVAAGLPMSSENGGSTGTLRGGFLMRVQRLGNGNVPISVDRQVTIPLSATARVMR